MMSRAAKIIIFVLFLIAAINIKFLAWAEEALAEGAIVRPVMKYKSDKLRDPFKTYLIEEEPEVVVPENVVSEQPQFDLTKLSVQGIIWGGKIPQAIINNQVLTIGDLIEGAEIVSIEKKGITLSFGGAILDLAAPGRVLSQKEVK